MAAGSSKASVGALEAALDRKLQSVSNTMESIQSLSSWCLENRKQHSAIVHYWMKWFRRSGYPHRLNLFYLANDIIQTCKRRNAIIFRESFADVLPEAASLVRDPSVMKSVERVFKIWEERSVYPEDTIATFRAGLSGNWNKRDRDRERDRDRGKSSRPKHEKPPPEAPAVNPKAALKSKIVAEFRPQSLIEDLLAFKRAVDSTDLKEKQLSNMRVDVCSTETLKRLKDKAGGKKFSKDFEEASSKLEEFVNHLDKQVKTGPSLTEALENAGIFYEAQYREVKVVVNAYKTFANRVNNLKKKLDQLKATLPDPEDSPVPSPAVDAPSPTGSESPFQGIGDESPLSPEVEPLLSDSSEPPKDNRVVEDMEMSEDEETPPIIVAEREDKPEPLTPLQDISVTGATVAVPEVSPTASLPTAEPLPPVTVSASTPSSSKSPATTTPVITTASKPVTTTIMPSSIPLALPNLANVDLGKISSILSSLTSAMKTTGVSPAAKPSPGTPTTPNTNLGGAVKPPVQSAPNPLANILSKVEFTPESILSALSKTPISSAPNLQGLSSLIQSVAGSTNLSSGSTTLSTSSTSVNTVKDKVSSSVTPSFVSINSGFSPADLNPAMPLTPACKPPAQPSSSFPQPANTFGFSSQAPLVAEKPINQPTDKPKPPEENESSSLEMKIHNFLKGNPGFSGLDLNIPILSGLGPSTVPEPASEFHGGSANTSLDNIDGTPVRDERSGTPTQDEMMDKPSSSNVDSVSLLSKIISPGSSTPSSTRSPLINKDNEYQKLQTLPPYRSCGLPANSPNAYRQSSDLIDKPSIGDSSLDKFFSESTFPEDGDYRNFDFSGPPAMANLDTMPTKPLNKQNMHIESMEYPPITQSYGQVPDYGRQSFPPPMQQPFMPGESSNRLSPPPESYGGYSLRGNNLESTRSPSPPKDDAFYLADNNHNFPLLHPSIQQTKYSDSANVQSNFHPKNSNPVRPPTTSAEPPGQTAVASATLEFKNMLKNASRRTSEEPQFGQTSLDEDGRITGLGHAGRSSEDQSKEQYPIETRVSSSSVDLPDSKEEKGAPIETLGYHNVGSMRMSGEPIKTVESMRVGMKGGRGHGLDGGRSDWFEMGSSEGSFDESSTDEQPLVSGNSSVGFKTQYDEHLTHFQDPRAPNMPSFDRLLPPPPIPPALEHGGPFQMDQAGPPPGPPPVLPPDPGSLFGREIPIGSRIPSIEPPKLLPHIGHPPPVDHLGNPFPVHHTAEHGGIPFSPPPNLDMRNPFSQDHGAVHQGMMNEPYAMHSSSTIDHGSRDYNIQNNQPLGRVSNPMTSLPREHFGGFGGPRQSIGSHHRDHMHTGGQRAQRPQYRPRDSYSNLKRSRPPYGRGQQFFSPKRPFYPPRY
ncbi:regulation of nuclear pre-mRNA domain-containing protein 2 [Gastrophryne carolinensis]